MGRPQRQRRAERKPERSLTILANATAIYPLFALAALHGEWFLSWWILGHPPRPSLDDPKYIDGASWMHEITGLALVGCLPMGCVAAVLNTWHFLQHESPGLRLGVRILVILGLWFGAGALLGMDQGRVVSWWLD